MFNQLTEPSLRNHLPSLFLTQECWYTPSCPCQNPSLQCLQWHWVLCYPLVIKHGLLEITHFYRLLSLISLSPLNYTYKIMVLTTTYIYIYVSPFYVSLYIIIYKSPLYVCMYIYITTTVYIYIHIYIYIDPNFLWIQIASCEDWFEAEDRGQWLRGAGVGLHRRICLFLD